MTPQTLEILTAKINSINTCEELQKYHDQVLGLLLAEEAQLAESLEDLLGLTNPVTFIANMILMIKKQMASIAKQQVQLANDIQSLTTAINTKASQIQNCTIS